MGKGNEKILKRDEDEKKKLNKIRKLCIYRISNKV